MSSGPRRYKDAPISEAAIAGCAVGSAAMGMRPIVEIMYIDFITIAMDQMINYAAKFHQLSNGTVRVPVVFRTQGGVGLRNSSQHSQSLENWFVNVPGLITVMPSTPYDVKGLLKSAIRDDNPVVFIEHKALYFTKGEVPVEEYTIPLGVADVKREGKEEDEAVCCCGGSARRGRMERRGDSCGHGELLLRSESSREGGSLIWIIKLSG